MPHVQTDAIVLRTYEFSETSLVVHLFTRSEGKIHALAKGARLDELGVKYFHLDSKQNQAIDQIADRINNLPAEMAENPAVKAMAAQIAKQTIEEMAKDPEAGRKLAAIWTPQGDARLKGSRFGQLGIDLGGLEMMYDILQSAKVRGLSRGPSEELENAFNDLSKAAFVSEDEIRRRDIKGLDDVYQRYHGNTRTWSAATHRAFERDVKAMDTAEAGYGQQLIGTQYVQDLFMGARSQSLVFDKFDSFEMTAPTAYLPIEADLPEMLYVSESTASDSSNYTTSKTGSRRVTVSATKFVIHQMWSGEMEEDSIIPHLPFLQQQAKSSIAHYSDSLLLNGDTTNSNANINSDDADPADTKHYLAFDGLRHACLVDNTNNATDGSSAAVTWNKLMNLKNLMVDRTYLMNWGHPQIAEDLIYFCDPETHVEISKLAEVLTIDKYGSNAAVVNGEVAKIMRHPLIPSVALYLTETTGTVYATPSATTFGQVLAVNRRGFKVGWRRRIKTEFQVLPGTDQTRVVHSLRLGFGRFAASGSASSIEAAALLYDIAVNQS